MKVLLPALEVPKKLVIPKPPLLQSPGPLEKAFRFPAVALLVNDICPLRDKKLPTINVCVFPESFVIPTPLIVKGDHEGRVTV